MLVNLIAVFLASVAAVGFAALSFRRPATAVGVICVLAIFSSHVMAVANSHGMPVHITRGLILLKDLAATILVLALIARTLYHRRDHATVAKAVAYVGLVVIVFAFVRPDISTIDQLAAMRGVLIGMVAVVIGSLLTPTERLQSLRILIGATLIATVYGVGEQLLAPDWWLTEFIDVNSYYVDVKEQLLFINPGTGILPGNYLTSQGFPRMTGTFGDSLSSGMVLGTVLPLAVIYRHVLQVHMLTILVLAGGLMATFTRSGWILAVLTLGAHAVAQVGPKRAARAAVPWLAVVACAAMAIAPVRAYLLGIVEGRDTSTLAHLEAFEANLDITSYPLIGTGWGTGGAVAAASGVETAVTRESLYLALFAQAGLIVGLALIALLVWTVPREGSLATRTGMFLGLAASGVVSENLLAFNAGFIPLLGICLLSSAREDQDRPRHRKYRPLLKKSPDDFGWRRSRWLHRADRRWVGAPAGHNKRWERRPQPDESNVGLDAAGRLAGPAGPLRALKDSRPSRQLVDDEDSHEA